MADDENIFANPSPEMQPHVRDYAKFVTLFKWGAVVCFIVGFIWLSIVKAYW